MNYRCINKADFKNLTLDKEYPGVLRDDYISITSDNGTEQRYHRKYFREIPDDPLEILRNGLLVSIEDNDVIIRYGNSSSSLGLRGSSISCGVHQMQGIEEIRGMIENGLSRTFPTLSLSAIAKVVWTKIITFLREETDYHYFIASSMVWEDDAQTLNTLSEANTTGLNPNSSNEITIWIFNCKSYRDEED